MLSKKLKCGAEEHGVSMDEFLKALGVVTIVALIVIFIAWQVYIYQDIKNKDYEIEFLDGQLKDLKNDVKYLTKKVANKNVE